MARFILWDCKRGSWQYDVIVAGILAFVFLTPRELFRDQPRVRSVVLLPAEEGVPVFWIEAELLSGAPPDQRLNRAAALLKQRTGKAHRIVRIEPIFNSEDEVKGYMAYTKP